MTKVSKKSQTKQSCKTDVMVSILNDLEYEKKNYEEPSSYMGDEYYVRCRAKAEAFEEAINIVKKYYT